MLKMITKTMCITLLSVLFAWGANAQVTNLQKASGNGPVLRAMPVESSRACNAIQNLQYTLGGGGVTLTWDAPRTPIETGWIGYSGENESAIGFSSGTATVMHIAARWTAGDLAEVSGATLTKVKFWITQGISPATHKHTIKVWQGGSGTNPGTLLTQQDIPGDANSGAWYEMTLIDAVPLDIEKELWIGVSIEVPVGTFAGSCDAGPAVVGFGDLIGNNDGTSFSSLYELTANADLININWNIEGMLENGKGNPVSLTRSTVANVAHYNVFRDNEEIGTVAETTFSEEIGEGVYVYGVVAVYDNDCQSPMVKKIVQNIYCPPIEDLKADSVGVKRARITWSDPIIPKQFELTYSKETIVGAIGLGGGTAPYNFSTAIRWAPEDLQAIATPDGGTGVGGYTIKEIKFGTLSDAVNTIFRVRIWQGGTAATPGTMIVDQPVDNDLINFGDWTYVALTNPVVIDDNQELWIGVSYVQPEGAHPAGYDAGPAVNGKGNKVLNGPSWGNLPASYNNNCIGGILETPTGAKVELDRAQLAVTGYKLYRNGDLIYEPAASSHSYNDLKASYGENNYCLIAVYNNGGESDIDDPKSCTSIFFTPPTTAINDGDAHIATIFPNPATTSVTVKGEGITKVEVYNTVGQIVDTKTSNFEKIDVSSYNSGVYFFKVFVGNEFSTQRIMITR